MVPSTPGDLFRLWIAHQWPHTHFWSSFLGRPKLQRWFGPYFGFEAALFRLGLHFRSLVDFSLKEFPGLLSPGAERRGSTWIVANGSAHKRVRSRAREKTESPRANNYQEHTSKDVLARRKSLRLQREQLPVRWDGAHTQPHKWRQWPAAGLRWVYRGCKWARFQWGQHSCLFFHADATEKWGTIQINRRWRRRKARITIFKDD